MPLKLHELTTDEEFKLVVEVEHEAYCNPFNGFWEMLKGPSQEECYKRQLGWHKHDPSSRWVYVTDEETGKVIGGAEWNFYETNPYVAEQPTLTASWLPEGELERED